MPFEAGDQQASSGMAKAIYDQMAEQLLPALRDAQVKDEDLAKIDERWRALSFAIASGVVAELTRSPSDPFFTWLHDFAGTLANALGSGKLAEVAEFLKLHPVPSNLRGIQ